MGRFPNILFLMSDEHRFDVSGFAGNRVVRTPNLDRLAQDAVVFDNAYAPNPVCVPCRQCMAMGQYPSQCGVRRFEDDLPPFSRTFARQFTDFGYRTIASGKLHHHGMDQMQGWQIRVAADCVTDRPYFGAQQSPAVMPHPPLKWSESGEIRRAGPGDSAYARRDRLAVQGLKDMIYESFVDSFYDRALPDQPTLLYLGLLNPHYPYIARQELFDYYLNRVEFYPNKTPFPHPFLGRCPNETGPVIPGEQVTEREARRAIAAYYANIETIDRQYGEILKELENAGQDLDDWIIIYTSDHGEMLGEHGVWEKQKFFEGSVRVPLFIRWPRRFAPRHVQQNVNLADLFATLCELCNVPMPEGRCSKSLVPLMEGDGSAWDDVTYSEWNDNLMVKKGPCKYEVYPDGSELLFDLEKDPGETRDFSKDADHAAVFAELRALAQAFRCH